MEHINMERITFMYILSIFGIVSYIKPKIGKFVGFMIPYIASSILCTFILSVLGMTVTKQGSIFMYGFIFFVVSRHVSKNTYTKRYVKYIMPMFEKFIGVNSCILFVSAVIKHNIFKLINCGNAVEFCKIINNITTLYDDVLILYFMWFNIFNINILVYQNIKNKEKNESEESEKSEESKESEGSEDSEESEKLEEPENLDPDDSHKFESIVNEGDNEHIGTKDNSLKESIETKID